MAFTVAINGSHFPLGSSTILPLRSLRSIRPACKINLPLSESPPWGVDFAVALPTCGTLTTIGALLSLRFGRICTGLAQRVLVETTMILSKIVVVGVWLDECSCFQVMQAIV